MLFCDQCAKHGCEHGQRDQMPANCPSKNQELLDQIKQKYQEPQNQTLAKMSALVESEFYCQKTRIEEIMEFCKKAGFHKLGVAFCIGSSREAATACRIFRANGFEVASVICKVGGISKEFIGVEPSQQVNQCAYEAMCNPIGQAEYLNQENTDFNVAIGLCVGHDSLLFQYSHAPVTVLVAKDRVLGHNPVAALYLADGYYKDKLFPKK